MQIKYIMVDLYEDKVNQDLHSYTVINGNGYITDGYDKIELKKEETIYIPNNIEYKIVGDLELLKSYI